MYSISVNLSKLSTVAESQGLYQTASNQNNLYSWVEVLVDCPGCTDLLTYKIPSHLEVKPGDILSVPFGATQVGGIAIKLLNQPPANLPWEKIKDVEDIVSRAFFPPSYWSLLNQVALYYYTPLMQVIRVALPPGLLGRSQRRLKLTELGKQDLSIYINPIAQQVLNLLQKQPTGDYSYYYIQQKIKVAYRGIRELLRLGLAESYLEPPKLNQPKLQKSVTLINNDPLDLTTKQKDIIEVLRRNGGEMWQTELLQISHSSSSSLKALCNKDYIVIDQREILRREQGIKVDKDGEKTLTNEQEEALKVINSLNSFSQVLLHGVTGSGKTEVYLQAIAPLINQKKSALILVPEIGLTPQLTDRFRARFGDQVYVYHSALSEGERYDTWRKMLTAEPQIIIGTRSAVFAPLPNLGLIILDEEHDSSFKQDQPIPTYHARTVAQWRAELENCPLILGSATPSLESWVNLGGKFSRSSHNNSHYLSLPTRINSRPLPPVEIVDMREELKTGNRSIFSRKLQNSLQQLQQTGQQGILFIHRRGHSTFVSCRSCGYVIECPHCDVSLSYHHVETTAPELLICHYCNYQRSHPPHCPECSSPYLKFFGSGTQKVAEELRKQFPELRLIRFDSDTTRTKDAHRTLISKFANGEADLLIGTQMITKGLDLPQVTLVGVVAADGLLHLSDYRANERTFQTLTQVAGRAGRGEDPGKVIIQTYTPEHPVIAAVQQHDYHSFSTRELAQRQTLNYPPLGRLILLKLSSLDPIQVQNTAQIIAVKLTEKEDLEILGPAPASILRVANRYRWQILIKFPPDTLPNLPDWEDVRSLCPKSVSLTIDVDPVNIM
ncbi:primosomal protein N' [Anabaena sp. FACHB-1237]|uniref:primosomal protein N' n=1 Tax=Anabaena sp. FACHB-1237 TaxID=2692769 RepID=UPI0016804EE2|nr:primosomal protein N' [Anabaena sp. FACHB-1237]MBD2139228.1 primosomal protein N' [Anabaena sp. FACHB-1237]